MAFLGVKIPTDVGRLIAGLSVTGDKKTISDYHISILYLEDEMPIEDFTRATEVAYRVISEFTPFLIKCQNVSHFSGDDGVMPIIIPIKSKKLQKIHKKICKEFDKNDISYIKKHINYNPHITLAFSSDEYDDFKIIPPIEFVVNDIMLWGADDNKNDTLSVIFALKGPRR